MHTPDTNMCIKATQNGKPMQLIGDGEYHTYRFDWHSGTHICMLTCCRWLCLAHAIALCAGTPGNVTSAYVDFFIDDIYMGTNNAFVPTNSKMSDHSEAEISASVENFWKIISLSERFL